MSPARALAVLLVGGACAAACHQPTQPVVPPRGPVNPTNDVAQSADDDTTDASIVNDASPKLDAATVGLDSGIPLR